MSPYRRNIMVGATVLGALIILGWMILKFGEKPAKLFAPPSMSVRFIADRADGLAEGSMIEYRGVAVGRVLVVQRTVDNLHVAIDGVVDVMPPLPANVVGEIRSSGLLGAGSAVRLALTNSKPEGKLAAGSTLTARFVGLEVFPPEFSDLAGELRQSARQFRETNLIPHIDEQVQKVGRILDSIEKVSGDPKVQDDMRLAIANIRSASAMANRIGAGIERATTQFSDTLAEVKTTAAKAGGSIETVSRQLQDRFTQIARALSNMESITGKLDQGRGTVGQLINDPKLYESLVETSRELNATILDLKRLVEQWEQEGIAFKVK
jgi:phospholipid/cholesterol/gamma-HCH transport system substrate-binding protein